MTLRNLIVLRFYLFLLLRLVLEALGSELLSLGSQHIKDLGPKIWVDVAPSCDDGLFDVAVIYRSILQERLAIREIDKEWLLGKAVLFSYQGLTLLNVLLVTRVFDVSIAGHLESTAHDAFVWVVRVVHGFVAVADIFEVIPFAKFRLVDYLESRVLHDFPEVLLSGQLHWVLALLRRSHFDFVFERKLAYIWGRPGSH